MLKRVLIIRLWHAYGVAFMFGLALAGVCILFVLGLGYVSDIARTNRELAQANRRSIANLARIQRLEKPPTQAQLTAAALRALAAIRACAKSPSCRRQNPGVQRVARNLGTGRIPAARRPSRGNGSRSDGSGGANSGGGSVGTRPRTPSPVGPTQTGRRPQPTTRPSAPAPPPANPPAARPPAAPPAQTQSAPAPQPTPSVPPATTPPVGPVPPVTTPSVPLPVPVPPIQVCTPVIKINCKDLAGRFVSASATVDPASNSGRGNDSDRLCDRLKVPCDGSGGPIFPPGLIRLP